MDPQTHDRAPSRYLWSAKRQHRRAILDVPLIVKWEGTVVVARSLDLSEGGMGAKLRGKCSEGQAVELQFALDDSGVAMHLHAVCKYTSDARHGFQFLDITTEQRETIAQLVKAKHKKIAT